MTHIPDRRHVIQLALTALPALLSLRQATAGAAAVMAPGSIAGAAPRDFDFFLGSWNVHHRI